MSIYGYCRVSTQKQVIQRQVDNIRVYDATAEIYSDSFTGTTTNRPQWSKLYKMLDTGDTVIFDSVSRMSRNADEGIALYMELYHKGISLVFLNEPHINTSVYKEALQDKIQRTGDDIDIILEAIEAYLKRLATHQIRIAFEQAEKEVKDLQKRTSEGMRSKNAGKKISEARTGKHYNTSKARMAKSILRKHARAFGGSLTDEECMKLAGVSIVTYYRYKRELQQEELK